MLKRSVLPAALLLVLSVCACGSGNSGLGKLESIGPSNSADGQSGAVDIQALPGISELENFPGGAKAVRIFGPGWYEFYPEDYMSGVNSSVEPTGATLFSGSSGNAWAIYRLSGFSDDASPTSLHTHVEPATSAPYFITVADFNSGRWETRGPFTGDQTIQLPGTDSGESHPLDFVSPTGRFYCGIMDSSGDDLRILNMEVGVHGGLNPPAPPDDVLSSGLPSGKAISWRHSPDYNKPDFAGYTIEARRFLSGAYVPVGQTDDPLVNIFADTSEGLATGYRVAAVDSSGNRSAWAYTPEGSVIILDEIVMNLDLKMPRGPLYGPLDVTFDMSGSTSLDGSPIAEYKLAFDDGALNYTGPDPVVTRNLKPGCYLIRAEINDGSGLGGSSGSTLRKLVVYPRWESDNILVRDVSDSSIYDRYYGINGGRDPQTGDICMVGLDQTMQCLVSLRGQPGNLKRDLIPTPFLDLLRITDPVFLDGNAYFCAMFGSGVPTIVTVGPERSSVMPLSAPYIWLQPLIAHGKMYLIAANAGGFAAIDVDTPGPFLPLASGLTSLELLDCEFNETTGNVEFAYSDSGNVNWLVWNPVDNTLPDSSSNILTGVTVGLDIECDQNAGTSCVFSRVGTSSVFTKLQEGTWTAQAFVDNSSTNYWPADLKWLAGNPYAFVSLSPGNVHIYRLDSAGGVLVNTGDYTSDGLYSGFFLPEEGNASFLCFDAVNTRELNINRLFLDDTETPLEILSSRSGYGNWLDCAAGADGLYLQVSDGNLSTVKYLFSSDGLSWSLNEDLGSVEYADLFSTAAGDVFRTIRSGPGYEVDMWNGASWASQFALAGPQTHDPLSPRNTVDGSTGWVVHDTATDKLVREIYSAGTFTQDVTSFPESTNVYGGAATSAGFTSLYFSFCHYSQPALFDSFGVLNNYLGDVRKIVGFDDSFSNFSNLGAFKSPSVAGRTMEQQVFRNGLNTNEFKYLAAWSVNGHAGSAFRYTYYPSDSTSLPSALTDLPLNQVNWDNADFRRTVSAAQARGLTAVSIMANIHGKDAYMEWSNFGDWEQLPLPSGIDAPANAKLFIDNNGRWYLFWQDIETGNLLCRRTIAGS